MGKSQAGTTHTYGDDAMDERLIFLLIGLAGKQLIDEIKAIAGWKVTEMERRRELTATYVPIPAVAKGSREAHSAMVKAAHQAQVAPELKILSRRLLWWRFTPVVAYAIVTAILIGLLYWPKMRPTDGGNAEPSSAVAPSPALYSGLATNGRSPATSPARSCLGNCRRYRSSSPRFTSRACFSRRSCCSQAW